MAGSLDRNPKINSETKNRTVTYTTAFRTWPPVPAISATGIAAKAHDGVARAVAAIAESSARDFCYCCAFTTHDLTGAFRLVYVLLIAYEDLMLAH